jgi:hypothetical protein
MAETASKQVDQKPSITVLSKKGLKVMQELYGDTHEIIDKSKDAQAMNQAFDRKRAQAIIGSNMTAAVRINEEKLNAMKESK